MALWWSHTCLAAVEVIGLHLYLPANTADLPKYLVFMRNVCCIFSKKQKTKNRHVPLSLNTHTAQQLTAAN